MESKTKKRAVKKAPVKRKTTARRNKTNVVKVKPYELSGVCVNCAPLGHTQVLAILLVSVFSLVSILTIASYKIDRQSSQIDSQIMQIESLLSQN